MVVVLLFVVAGIMPTPVAEMAATTRAPKATPISFMGLIAQAEDMIPSGPRKCNALGPEFGDVACVNRDNVSSSTKMGARLTIL
jgi:hypothetical protein